MAATGTPTPNIGLRIPQGTDPASVDDINYNSNLLDTKLGAVGNTSVQEQINSLNSKIESIGKIAKLETTNVTSFTLNTTAGDVHLIVIGSNNGNGSYIGIVSVASGGTFSIAEINKGNALTIDTSDANKFKVTSSLSARKYYIYDFCLNGDNVTF